MKAIGGSLLPLPFVMAHVAAAGAAPTSAGKAASAAFPAFARWWREVEATCGPASGIRAITDEIAMPLAAQLGFAASNVRFDAATMTCRLRRRDAPPQPVHVTSLAAPIACIASRWADRAPLVWRRAIALAHDLQAPWCLIVAPPFVQVIDARSLSWNRRFLIHLGAIAERADHFARLLALISADALTAADHPASLAMIATAAEGFQDRVRNDLQAGVSSSLHALQGVSLNHAESLAIVYRILFLLFVEARDLIPWRHPLYRPAYSIGTLCDRALRDPRARGFWPALAAISRLLRAGCRTPRIDVPPFNGHLFARATAPALERRRRATRTAQREDAAIAHTLSALSTRASRCGRESISYPDLGVEQLGAVYERVLGADDRKETGTFYTPTALTESVVRTTLSPLTDVARADDILRLRVVDPAMGSGAFLVAACRHLAVAYERALVHEGRIYEHEIDESTQAGFRRLVAQRCLYGVDRNPTAVQLARLSLWLATLSAGKPLTFFDHRLRVGDALVGARPSDLRHAGPKRPNASSLPFDDQEFEHDAACVAVSLAGLATNPDDTIDDVKRKERSWSMLQRAGTGWAAWKHAADLWCAQWFAGDARLADAELRAAIDALVRRDRTLPTGILNRWLQRATGARETHRLFHWPIEFADVFFDESGRVRTDAGFDAVVGNPPWEMVRADHDRGSTSRSLVRFIRDSGVYTACARGHVNLYQPFVERALSLARPGGHVGLVVPWGLASDDGASELRRMLLDRCQTYEINGFDNRAGIFPIHRGLRFMTFHASPGGRTRELSLRCGITRVAELEHGGAPLRFSRRDLESVGGSSARIPDARSAIDADFLKTMTARFPGVGSSESYAARFGRELNITEDRDQFSSRGLPVIEGKHLQPFVIDTDAARFHIPESRARTAVPSRTFDRARLAYRDVSAVSNRQSLIAALVPPAVVTSHTVFCLKSELDQERQHFLAACFNSTVLNRLVRMLMGGHLTTTLVEGLPVPPWTGRPRQRRIAALAENLSNGKPCPPTTREVLDRLVTHEYLPHPNVRRGVGRSERVTFDV